MCEFRPGRFRLENACACRIHSSALALVQDECGQSDAAIATVAKAGKLIVPAASAAPLSLAFKERVLRYQVCESDFENIIFDVLLLGGSRLVISQTEVKLTTRYTLPRCT